MDPQSSRARGRCSCGYVGWVTRAGKLYGHSRQAPGFVAPGLTQYTPSYNLEITAVCQECGVLVMDTDAHDDFHLALVEDLNLIRKEAAGEHQVHHRELDVRGRRRPEPGSPSEWDRGPHATDRS
jgi:hypothetical protein